MGRYFFRRLSFAVDASIRGIRMFTMFGITPRKQQCNYEHIIGIAGQLVFVTEYML